MDFVRRRVDFHGAGHRSGDRGAQVPTGRAASSTGAQEQGQILNLGRDR